MTSSRTHIGGDSGGRTVATTGRTLLNKVPEVTIWFWLIKIFCTTVGESFADWINETLGFGLINTSVLFTVVFVVVLGWQLRLREYKPFAYWLTVVVVSVTGTLYTDILTDREHVPLAVSTSVFAVVLAVVFGIWWLRERTLSIHSIVTLPRESFYWLAILVTFALGTAAGDWTLELTGWTASTSVLLPLGLIAAVVIGWRLGANAVLAFWLAYILTRPLGANLGDWLATPRTDHGLGLGTAGTSVAFLLAILATVIYLTVTGVDTAARHAPSSASAERDTKREHAMLAYFVVVIAASAGILTWAHKRPHATAASEETPPPETTTAAPGALIAKFPRAEVAKLRAITEVTETKLNAGDQAGATRRGRDLETAWDVDQPLLQPKDPASWQVLDGQIDRVLSALRASKPNVATEQSALTVLLSSLR